MLVCKMPGNGSEWKALWVHCIAPILSAAQDSSLFSPTPMTLACMSCHLHLHHPSHSFTFLSLFPFRPFYPVLLSKSSFPRLFLICVTFSICVVRSYRIADVGWQVIICLLSVCYCKCPLKGISFRGSEMVNF